SRPRSTACGRSASRASHTVAHDLVVVPAAWSSPPPALTSPTQPVPPKVHVGVLAARRRKVSGPQMFRNLANPPDISKGIFQNDICSQRVRDDGSCSNQLVR